MGYYMYQHETNFHIKKENFDGALAAIKKMIQDGEATETHQKGFHFRWVNSKTVLASTNLGDALVELRWIPSFNMETGDINDIEFTGEKLGDEETYFKVLAPFVEKDSYIVAEGSDSEWWRWFFDGTSVEEQDGEVVFHSKKNMR